MLFKKEAHKLELSPSNHWWKQQWAALFIQWLVSSFLWSIFKAFDGSHPSFSPLLSPWTKPSRPFPKLFIEILQNLSLRRIFYPLLEMSTRAFDPGKLNQATVGFTWFLSSFQYRIFLQFNKIKITCWR